MRRNIFVFVGEFSYELNWYVPWLRKACKTTYANDYNIFYGKPKGERLYQDFISEYRVLPPEILNQLKYPCTVGEHTYVNKKRINVTPYFVIDYISESNFGHSITLPPYFNNREENPNGDYIHYTPSSHADNLIKDFLNKTTLKKEETVLILPKYRIRDGRPEDQNWSKENWEKLIYKLIDELNYNVISLYFPEKNSTGGSYNISIDSKKYFTVLNPSFDQQLALLKNTKYSIYGSTGANNIPFFTNTPMITFVLGIYGNRLFHEWQKKLTNNHEKQKIVLVENLEKYTFEECYSEIKDFEKNYKNHFI